MGLRTPAPQAPWRMVMLDLRNHGSSARLHGFHPPHSIQTAAEDVAHFIHVQLGYAAARAPLYTANTRAPPCHALARAAC